MPDLEHTYLDYDLALLRAIAAQAGVDLTAPNPRTAAAELAQALKQRETLELLLARVTHLQTPAKISNYAAQVHAALASLLAAEGQHPVAGFIRKFGDVRPLGPAALAREQPWEYPATVTEALYFNGLIGRAFMDSDTGPQEFFFIPSDLFSLMPPMEASTALHPTQSITPSETVSADTRVATSILIDDAVTLLAAIQLNPARPLEPEALRPHLHLPCFNFLTALFADLDLVTPDDKLNPDRVKPFLQAPRTDQLRDLAEAWLASKTWNDLLHVPTLRPEPGVWHNDPVAARNFVIQLCADLPPGEWRSLDSFVAFVYDHRPDFQRPAGDYDSWYIRDAQTGDYVRGFDNWDRVDGALIRYLLTGPMHWLGLVDVRWPEGPGREPDAFRLSLLFPAFASHTAWQIAERPKLIIVKHDGTLLVSRSANRYDRFQAARIGEWILPASGLTPDAPYLYRFTGQSLQSAAAQGITAKHIVSFLRRAAEHMPQHIADMIERWGRNGVEARAASLTIIKLSSPDVLETLMRSSKTRRWLGEAIGDRAAEVKDWERLREAMAEIGLIAEWQTRS